MRPASAVSCRLPAILRLAGHVNRAVMECLDLTEGPQSCGFLGEFFGVPRIELGINGNGNLLLGHRLTPPSVVVTLITYQEMYTISGLIASPIWKCLRKKTHSEEWGKPELLRVRATKPETQGGRRPRDAWDDEPRITLDTDAVKMGKEKPRRWLTGRWDRKTGCCSLSAIPF